MSQPNGDALLLGNVVANRSRDVGVTERPAGGVNSMLCVHLTAEFLPQFVDWLGSGDPLAAQPVRQVFKSGSSLLSVAG